MIEAGETPASPESIQGSDPSRSFRPLPLRSVFLWSFAVAMTSLAPLVRPAYGQVAPIGRTGQPVTGVRPIESKSPLGSVLPIESSDTGNEKTVFAQGTATVFNGNVKNARQSALQSAYGEAVALGAGTEIGRLTLVRNVKAVTDVVASRSRGFIRSFEIVGEDLVPGEPPRYEVRIRAVVQQGTATGEESADSLKLFLGVIGNPVLMVLLPSREVSEGGSPDSGSSFNLDVDAKAGKVSLERTEKESAGQRRGDGGEIDYERAGSFRSAEAALAQVFLRYGYQVYTSDDVVANGWAAKEQLDRARSGTTADGFAIARKAGVDLLLTGAARFSSERVRPQGVEFVSVTTEASAKALVVSNRYVIDAFHRTVTKAHPSRLAAYAASVEGVAEQIAGTLAWKIPQILASQPRILKLAIEGITLDEAQKLKSALESFEGIDAVRFDTLPTTKSRTTILDLLSGYVQLDANELVTICSRSLGKPITLVDADKFQIRIRA